MAGHMFASVLGWLRTGYPDGVPPTDYIPLIALLRHRLSDSDVDSIVGNLRESGHLAPDREQVGDAITAVSDQPPSDEDLTRVSARLAAAGWPLAAGEGLETVAGPG